ncbi:hypothetical protein [Streptomyces pseudovenezuelae]
MALCQPLWGTTDIIDPPERKRHVYADLTELAWMGFEIGTIREPLLRDMGRRFLAIVSEEHSLAVAAGPPAVNRHGRALAHASPPPTVRSGHGTCGGWCGIVGGPLGEVAQA